MTWLFRNAAETFWHGVLPLGLVLWMLALLGTCAFAGDNGQYAHAGKVSGANVFCFVPGAAL